MFRPSSNERQLKIIERQIEALSGSIVRPEVLCNLRKRRNILASAFCRLPTEIMWQILRDLLLTVLTQKSSPTPAYYVTKQIVGWAPVLSVCSSVRAAAVGLPVLWRYIDANRRKEWVELCMERAQDMPLLITCSFIPLARPTTIDMLISLLPRAEKVMIVEQIVEYAAAHFNQQRLAMPLPLLRGLHVTKTPLFGPPFLVSATFLGGQTASLHSLHLDHVALGAEDVIFPTLTQLTLCEISHGPELGRRLMRLIRGAPRLECLSLTRISNTTLGSPLDQVNLPHLKVARIHSSPEWLWALTQALPAPRDEFELVALTHQARYGREQPAIRAQVLQRFFEVSDTIAEQLVDNELRFDDYEDGPSWSLTLRSWSALRCLVTYTDRHKDIQGQEPAMRLLTMLVVHSSAALDFIAHVARQPSETFLSLERIALEGYTQWDPLEFDILVYWLRKRYQSTSVPLRTLELRGVPAEKGTRESRSASATVRTLCLVQDGLVDEVIES